MKNEDLKMGIIWNLQFFISRDFVIVTRFLSNAKCAIQKQLRHAFPVMLSEAKLNARQ